MDQLINNIKKKLSVDNLVEMMKEAKVIDNTNIKEEDVRKTLEKIDTNNLIDVDDLAAKLNEITEQSKAAAEGQSQASKLFEKAKTGFGVLSKKSEPEKKDDIPDNFSFLD